MKYEFLISALLISACSGGSSSSTEPLPPAANGNDPSPQTNSAPDLRVTLSSAQVFEHQAITIDASATTDADGDSLNYALKLAETPYAAVGDSNVGPVWTIDTTDVDADALIKATVTASDGHDTVAMDVEFTVVNYDRSPLNKTWEEASDTYEISASGSAKFSEKRDYGGFKGAHLLRINESDLLEIVELTFFNNTFRDAVEIATDMPGDEDALFTTQTIQYRSEYPGFAVVSPSTETVKVIKRESRSEGSSGGSLTLPGLCSATWKFIARTREITERSSLFIGTNNGLWGWLNAGRAINKRELSGLFTDETVWDPSGNFCHPGELGLYYDPEKRELNVWRTAHITQPDLPMPIAVNAPIGLDIVDVRIGYSDTRDPFIVLLFAGKTHDAPHQLSIFYEALNGQIEQLDYELPPGIPKNLAVDSIDTNFIDMERGGWGNRDSDIVIAVPETPYVYIIETQSSDTEGLSFGPLEFFEAGFGVRDIALIVTDGTNRYSLLTTDGHTLKLHKSALEFSRFQTP